MVNLHNALMRELKKKKRLMRCMMPQNNVYPLIIIIKIIASSPHNI